MEAVPGLVGTIKSSDSRKTISPCKPIAAETGKCGVGHLMVFYVTRAGGEEEVVVKKKTP